MSDQKPSADVERAAAILDGGAHCVIANPPYIACSDPVASEAYRKRYVSARGKYGLSAPFAERIFQLATAGGFTSQITSNAFMKREFGRPLCERVLPQLDLTHVIDTSGTFIPGHGTPTVILAGRNSPPSRIQTNYGDVAAPVFVVSSKRGEPSTPDIDLDGCRIAQDIKTAACRTLGLRIDKDEALAVRFLAVAVLMAFESRGLLVRRDEHIADSLVRLNNAIAYHDEREDEAGLWLETLADDLRRTLKRDDSDAARKLMDGIEPPRHCRTAPRVVHGGVVDEGSSTMRGTGSGWATPDTDWLGDLYQMLDNATVKKYAFCQTPWFVGDLLLDLAYKPAVAFFGLPGLRVLDPTCGTGHLLLAAFWRTFAGWASTEEHTAIRCAELALASTQGTDLNPVAAALARLRLTLAFFDASGVAYARPSTTVDGLLRTTSQVLPVIEVGDALLCGVVKPSPPVWTTLDVGALVPQPAVRPSAPAETPAPVVKLPPRERPGQVWEQLSLAALAPDAVEGA